MFMLFPQLPGETSFLWTLCQNETYFAKKCPKTFFHAVITSRKPHNLVLFQSEDFPKTASWGSCFRSNPKTFPSTPSYRQSPDLSRKRSLSTASSLEMCVITPHAFRPPHHLALFQSEDLPKTSSWGSRFRSSPKTFSSALSMSRSPAPSRRIELSTVSCLRNAFQFALLHFYNLTI
jgi:hypothetical protein